MSMANHVQQLWFLCSLPGTYVFMQRYRPLPGGPSAALSRLFDERADGWLEELAHRLYAKHEEHGDILLKKFTPIMANYQQGIVSTKRLFALCTDSP
jgi:hypothetical protein